MKGHNIVEGDSGRGTGIISKVSFLHDPELLVF